MTDGVVTVVHMMSLISSQQLVYAQNSSTLCGADSGIL